MSTPTPSIGFIGLGLMGSRMAARLLEAGYTLTVYNRTRDRAQPLAERGATVAGSPQELAGSIDVVLLSLTDDAAVEEVMRGPGGVLDGLRAGTTVIDLSTVSPQISRSMAHEVTVRGGAMLDAPVSGSTPQAEQGTLKILIGGNEDTYRRVEPVLAVLGQDRFYLGPNGMGLVMKLTVNALLGLGIQALAEAITLGRTGGLEIDQLLDVLGQMTVISPGQKGKFDNARTENYTPAFTVENMDKDFGLVAGMAEGAHVPLPAIAAAHQMNRAARAEYPDMDFSVVIRLMEQLAGLNREG